VIITFLKQNLQPASITFMLLLLVVGVALLYTKRPSVARLGRWWLTATLFAYWVISCPAGVGLLTRTVAGNYRPLALAEEARGAQAVVLLSAGTETVRAAGGRLPMVKFQTALRALETARVYRLLGNPLVIVSGGSTKAGAPPESDAMQIAVVALGVPPNRVAADSESANTHQEAAILKRMLRERGIDKFVIVTSPVHMGRSLAAFAAEGLHPIPSASPLYEDRGTANGMFPLRPNDTSLEVGNAVIYEWCARAYYWWKGWV
jgi:uncharacterized SAM-binding protein YcdF (DUF218 family)